MHEHLVINSSITESSVHYAHDSVVWIYVAPILIPLGLLENFVSVMILSQRAFMDMPSRWTLIILSITDSFVLFFGTSRYWLVAKFHFHPNETNDVSCKILSFLFFIVSHVSSCLVALISFERWLFVYYPQCKKSHLLDRYGFVGIFAVVIVINLHIPWTTTLMENKEHMLKNVSDLHKNICVSETLPTAIVVDVLDMLLLFFLPFSVIVTCNLAIIHNLRHRQRRLSKTSITSEHPMLAAAAPINQALARINDIELMDARPAGAIATHRRSIITANESSRRRTPVPPGKRRNTRITCMLLLVTSTFCVCNFPFALVHLLRTSLKLDHVEAWNQVWLFCYILVFINNCLNFPIYMISQPKFRREMCRVVFRQSCE